MNLSMPWICVGKKVCMGVIEMAKQQLETYIVLSNCSISPFTFIHSPYLERRWTQSKIVFTWHVQRYVQRIYQENVHGSVR